MCSDEAGAYFIKCSDVEAAVGVPPDASPTLNPKGGGSCTCSQGGLLDSNIYFVAAAGESRKTLEGGLAGRRLPSKRCLLAISEQCDWLGLLVVSTIRM